MSSLVKILCAFVDTLYLNAFQTDASFQIVKKKLSNDLRVELDQWKEQAQDEEENVPTRFSFDDRPLLMMMKGSVAPYQRQRKRQVNMDRMVAEVTGCLMTLEAWRACTDDDSVPATTSDFSDTLSVYYRLAEEYMEKRSKDYAEIVQKKRILYHIARSII